MFHHAFRRRIPRRMARARAVGALVVALAGASLLLTACGPGPGAASRPDGARTDAVPERRAEDRTVEDVATPPAYDSSVLGSWSGTLSNEADASDFEGVSMDVVSFDGYEDGTIAFAEGAATCTGTLAWRDSAGDAEVFDVAPDDGCLASTLSMAVDTSDGTLAVVEEWTAADGSDVTFSGYLDPE